MEDGPVYKGRTHGLPGPPVITVGNVLCALCVSVRDFPEVSILEVSRYARRIGGDITAAGGKPGGIRHVTSSGYC